jgi:hypothetical protein
MPVRRTHPQACVQWKKAHELETTGSTGATRPSLRNGVAAYTRSPRGAAGMPGLLAPVALPDVLARLDLSVGRSGPHAFAVRR